MKRFVRAALMLFLGCGFPCRAEVCTDFRISELVKDPMFQALYRKPKWGRLDHVKFGANGAYAANLDFEEGRSEKWYIEEQRYGAEAVEAGVDADDPASIEEAFMAFDWGFSRQSSDGGFRGTSDAFHSTSFFVEAVARSLLLLKQTGDARYQGRIEAYLPKLHAAALWMTTPRVAEKGRERNRPYTHRCWLVAAALGMTAELTGDRLLAEEAARSAEDGLSLQASQGYNPEKGGYDVNYNAVGLYFAEHYYTTLDCASQAPLKERIRRMLVRSLRWEATKVKLSGDIDTEGSTRVEHEINRTGKLKTAGYGPISRAFAFGAPITGDQGFHVLADRIAAYRWKVH